MKTGVIIAGHGSRSKQGASAFMDMVNRFSDRHPAMEVTGGFLELQQPSLEAAFESLRSRQISRIFVLPAFLFTGVHLKTDIPFIFRELARKYPQTVVRMGSYIGIGEHLINMCTRAIRQCENGHHKISRRETALLMVGVGASVQAANADIMSITRLVGEKEDFGYTQYTFIGKTATPYITQGLQEVLAKGLKRVVVCPLLLFPGVYFENITRFVEEARTSTTSEILLTSTIGDDDRLLEILDQRLVETMSGTVDLIAELPDDTEPRREFSNG